MIPTDMEVLIYIDGHLDRSDIRGVLKTATRFPTSGVSHYCVGSVGLAWSTETGSKSPDTIFVPPDDSEQTVALMAHQQQILSDFITTAGRRPYGVGAYGEGSYG
jgi:hypothetical protein